MAKVILGNHSAVVLSRSVSDEQIIRTDRLRIIALRAKVIRSLLNSDLVAAGRRRGFEIPIEFLETIKKAFLKGALTPTTFCSRMVCPRHHS